MKMKKNSGAIIHVMFLLVDERVCSLMKSTHNIRTYASMSRHTFVMS